ncbi:hypothetical protein NPIL_346801 [Nephila pilipes]|uniref:Uncharacterized protein n=1 Tax=Nephila pilipes TaxID=299642 RepID=A0A8X6TZZ5_NEPPI|nr:hypothetical protein NPIL_346801 [Nephila pilipes]
MSAVLIPEASQGMSGMGTYVPENGYFSLEDGSAEDGQRLRVVLAADNGIERVEEKGLGFLECVSVDDTPVLCVSCMG